MLRTLSSVAPLLLGAGVMLIGNSLLGITVPLKLDAARTSPVVTGVIMAAHFGGLFAGSLYARHLIAEVGHIRAFAGFAAIIAAATLGYGLLFDAVSWGLLRFLGGFCIAGLFAAMESWLNERSDNANRGRVLSVYMMVNYLAIMLGQLMVNLWDLAGSDAFIMAALLISISLVPVVLTRVEAPSLAHIKPLSVGALYRASPLALIGSCASGVVMGAYYGLGPIFGREIGLDVLQVSLFMSSVILGGMVLQWPIGRISDRYDRRTVLVLILLVVALACVAGILAALMGDPLAALLGVGVLLGGSMTTIYPICIAQAYDYLPCDQYVAASGALLLAYAVGATAGPILCALAMGALGAHAFFGFIGLIGAGFAAFTLFRMRVRAPLPAAAQEVFVSMPRMSPAAASLDPRAQAPEPEAGPATEAEPGSSPQAVPR